MVSFWLGDVDGGVDVKNRYLNIAASSVILLASALPAAAQNINRMQTRHQLGYSAMMGGQGSSNLDLALGGGESSAGAVGQNASRLAKGGQTRRTSDSPRASVIPLLGAPKDYTERYEANLGRDFTEQGIANELGNYRLTPQERLLSVQPRGHGNEASPSLVGRMEQSNTKSKRLSNGKSADVGSIAARSELYGASPSVPVATRSGADADRNIYRSPW